MLIISVCLDPNPVTKLLSFLLVHHLPFMLLMKIHKQAEDGALLPITTDLL